MGDKETNIRDMKLAVFLAVLGLCAIVSATVPIPQELLNEWSTFNAEDEFFDQMDTFLETGAQTQDGGDFEFKCETTCQLVQKNAAVGAAHAHAASLLQTEEGVGPAGDVQKQVEDAFYKNMDSFLETSTQ